GHRRRHGREDEPAAIGVVLVEPVPQVAAAHVLVDAQHHFAEAVGVDYILIIIWQRFGTFHGPTIVANRVCAAGVGVSEGADAVAAAGRAAHAGFVVLADALRRIVLEIIVRVGGGVGVGDAVDARPLGSDQAGVAVGPEDVLQGVGIASGLAGVPAIIRRI